MGIVTDRRTVIAGLAATGLASRIGPAAAQDLVAAAKREGTGTGEREAMVLVCDGV